jgi:hypothetical protein
LTLGGNASVIRMTRNAKRLVRSCNSARSIHALLVLDL